MRPEDITAEIEIPEGIQASFADKTLVIKGPKGEVKKRFVHPKVSLKVEGKNVVVISLKPTKKEKSIVYTYRAHIKNMFKGVSEPFKYELKICSSHFPMNVTFNNGEVVVKNFYGEKNPRKLKVSSEVKLKINDKIIEIECPNIEIAGTTASNIEQLTRVSNKDLRIFQDGIYIIKKPGRN